jgi:hypothetical protein
LIKVAKKTQLLKVASKTQLLEAVGLKGSINNFNNNKQLLEVALSCLKLLKKRGNIPNPKKLLKKWSTGNWSEGKHTQSKNCIKNS